MKNVFKAVLAMMLLGIISACNTLPSNLANVRLIGVASNVTAQGFTLAGTRVIVAIAGVGIVTTAGAGIANGSVVDVRGKHKSDGSVEATQISNKIEIKGSISSLDLSTSTLVILGQTVVADLNTVYEGSDLSNLSLASLKIGDYVEVAGLRQADGSLLASRIELEKGEKPNDMEVKGSVTGLDTIAKTFMLGMQLVDYSALSVTLANGQRVEVKGMLNVSNVLVATRIGSEDDDDSQKPTSGEIEIEGIAGNLDTVAKTLVVHGFQVNFANATIEGTPVNGSRVEVEGVVQQTDGLVKASKIQFKAKEAMLNDADGKIKGTISAIDAVAKTFTVGGVVYITNSSTKFERNDVHIAFADFQVNDKVEVRFVTSTLLARKIEIDLD